MYHITNWQMLTVILYAVNKITLQGRLTKLHLCHCKVLVNNYNELSHEIL